MIRHTISIVFDMAALLFVAALAVVLLVLVGVVRAEDRTRTFYNDKGQEVGRSERRGNTTIYIDASGRRTGRSERSSDGTSTFYDAQGRVIGRSRKR